MSSDRKRQMRRRSMYGTVLFLLGVIAIIAAVPIGSVGLAVAGAAVLLPGAVMLYQVGKSLS